MATQTSLWHRYDLLHEGTAPGYDVPRPLTDTRLAEIEERCRRAQTGPWTVDWGEEIGSNWVVATGPAYDQTTIGTYAVCTDSIRCSDTNAADGEDDAEFIAHARSDIPALLEEVRRLRALLAKEWAR